MAVWTRELNTNFNFPNISIYNTLRDGIHNGYEAIPNEGYVMYDTTANDTDLKFDEEQGIYVEVSATYYFTLAGLPLNFNFNNFTWVAVPRSEADEIYIFGGGNG